MKYLRWLTLTVCSLAALVSVASAEDPTVDGKVINFTNAVTIDSVLLITKDGILVDDAKIFWQSSDDKKKQTLLAGPLGTFVLTFKDGGNSRAHIVQYDGQKLALVASKATPLQPESQQPSNLNLGASNIPSASGAADAASLSEIKGHVKKWALEVAASWGGTGSGRENYIQRFDRTPAATCESIAKIFEETAGTMKANTDLANGKELLKGRLQTFYDSQKKPLRSINPATEDWQPFLRHLDENLTAKFPAIKLTDHAHARFVLLELAEAFHDLRAFFLDEQSGTGQGAGLGGSVGNGTGFGGTSASSGKACDHCRKRRCRCASLLFGF